MKKGFIFDLDGVLVDTAYYHFLAWQDLGKRIGINFDETFNETLKGISRMESLEKILAYGNKVTLFNDAEKIELVTNKNDFYVKLLDQLTQDSLLPGVLTFIKQAKKQGIPCAIASASKNAPMILERLNIRDHFDAIVDPETLANGKPDPEIFLKAAELIHISPEEAIGFEDSQAGITALNRANIYAVGILPQGTLIGADRMITSFKQLNIDELLAA